MATKKNEIEEIWKALMILNNKLQVINDVTVALAMHQGIEDKSFKYITTEDMNKFLHQHMLPYVEAVMKVTDELQKEAKEANKKKEKKSETKKAK